MSIISIRLPNKLLDEVDFRAHACKIPRAEYIRRALELMNHELKNKERKARLMKVSMRVREESMRINEEFSRIENDPKD